MELHSRDIHRIVILTTIHPSFKQQLAATELQRGLLQTGYRGSILVADLPGPAAATNDVRFILRAEQGVGEDYTIVNSQTEGEGVTVTIQGMSEQALLYGVFDLLEHQGALFSLDGDHYPLDRSEGLQLPDAGQAWSAHPRFAIRGLQPWPDFLNCITVFNREDYRAYLESMLRMRFNMLGIHVYAQQGKWVESFLSFEYAGVGHTAFTDTTATDRWGYLPQRTSRYGLSGSQYFDDEVFGADATRRARSIWEAAEMAQQLWRDAFAYAERLGISTGVGFEPYQLPDEILRACPPEVQVERHFAHESRTVKGIDPESRTARTILERRLAQLLEAYPSVKYVYLWEDELTSWSSQQNSEELSISSFKHAHDFLRRHAPDKRLVLGGWGGVVRNFAAFHRALPEDIIFTCLSDQFGWDALHEVFGQLEGRERWPILWIEDDPSMWFPQFHGHRFARDMTQAEQYGCQGLLGIHWRHRIIEPTANFQARRSWDQALTPSQTYYSYARTQASQERVPALAALLDDVDKNRRLLATGTGETRPDGRTLFRELSGDYREAFLYRDDVYSDLPQSLLIAQREVIAQLGRLLNEATSPEEREGLSYLYGQVGFLDPYAQAWLAGAKLQHMIREQHKRKQGDEAEAAAVIREQGVPLWIEVLKHTRQAMLAFQHTVATRNDLGMLASMHNKFVRIAVMRLRASLEEFLEELPPEAELAAAEAFAPDDELSGKVIVPTRPTRLLPGESIHISAIAPGSREVSHITINWRYIETQSWHSHPMQLVGRRTYTAELQMPSDADPGIEYYVEATFTDALQSLVVTAPVSGSRQGYLITI